MQIDMILFIIIGIFLILMFLIVYFKDIESNKKMQKYARSIEEQNRQIYKLTQQLTKDTEGEDGLSDELSKEFEEKITLKTQELARSVDNALKHYGENLNALKEEQDRIKVELNKQIQNINLVNSLVFNERQILNLFNSGKNEEQIAQELGLNLSEVQFILKMHNL